MEFQTRPTIINLYGMTGVGKTDLIRKLALYLNYGDKLCAINLDSGSEGYIMTSQDITNPIQKNTLVNRLRSLRIRTDERAIVLLDEFHRFSQASKERLMGISQGSKFYDDIWPFLSDGQIYDKSAALLFLKDEINDIQRDMIRRSLVSAQDRETYQYLLKMEKEARKINFMKADNENTPNPFMPFSGNIPEISDSVQLLLSPERKLYTWEYMRYFEFSEEDCAFIWNLAFYESSVSGDMKKYSTLQTQYMMKSMTRSIERDILSSLSQTSQLNFLSQKLYLEEKNLAADGEENAKPYSKLLVFVVANLDDVFLDEKRMRKDENKLLTHYEKPSISEVKNSLLKLFRPEQVSRLGHNFIFASPILAGDMKELCFKEIEKYENNIKKKYKIDVKFYKAAFWNIVVKEGIQGIEGVRPLFSAIMSLMGEEIPKILVLAHNTGKNSICWNSPDDIRVVNDSNT